MMSHTQFLIFIACGLMAAGRFTVPGHGLSYAGTFEAVSHILVGMVLMVGRKLTPQLLLLDLRQPRINKSVNRYAIESDKMTIDKPSINRLLDRLIHSKRE
jgi:hypothetical protein